MEQLNLSSNLYPVFSFSEQAAFVGEVGKVIRVFAGSDISSASSVVYRIKKPTGAEVTWTADVDDTNPYYATYATVSDDLDIEGPYLLSLEVTISGTQLKGRTVRFDVFKQFEDGFVPPPH